MDAVLPDYLLQTRLRALSASLRGRGVMVLHQAASGLLDIVENLPSDWPFSGALGRPASAALPPEITERLDDLTLTCRHSGIEQALDFDQQFGSVRRFYDARILPDDDGVIILVSDVTEQRSRDTAVASLLREVSHRSKNLLAIVQSVAMQTAHHSDSIKDFLDKFRGRLHALSSTQDLVTESNWRGTYFQSLVTAQLSRVGHAALAHMHVTGENPLLGPNASLHIGLALHELAANAVLHGGLGEGRAGNVWVDAHFDSQDGQPPELVIEWQETGIDQSKTRHAPRFGTLVLERIVPVSVGGAADYAIDEDKVSYRLVVGADQFES